MTIPLIYFTLRLKAYFRVRFPTPSGIDIYGMGLKKNSRMIIFDQLHTENSIAFLQSQSYTPRRRSSTAQLFQPK